MLTGNQALAGFLTSSRVTLCRWQGHEPAQFQPRQFRDGFGQGRHILRRRACLGRLCGEVHLDAASEHRSVLRALLRGEAMPERLRYFPIAYEARRAERARRRLGDALRRRAM